MSEPGRQTSGSSGPGLTFVRPLPRGTGPSAPAVPSAPASPGSLSGTLFPLRTRDDSGSAPPVTGLSLGHFMIEERIGRGGMGAVFRAMDRRLERVVALKVLSPEHSSDQDSVVRFQNEARAAAKLDHDNIARVHYSGEEHGLHFIAFEFVVGTNVRNLIVQKGRLSPADAVNYTLQIAEALRHTSAANVVHRDIKPSNIIISPTGRVKLVDLGLARQVNVDLSRDLTIAGTALGTFDYIAPEQAMDARNVDVRSDIYSLGCTLYHMLTGEPPYPTGTMFEKVMNHHRPVPPDPAQKNSRVPAHLSRIVQRMMASNPDERYPSAEALITDLVQIAEGLGLEPAYPETVIWSAPAFYKRSRSWDGTRTWMAVAIVLLVLVFLLDQLQFDSPRPTVIPEATLGQRDQLGPFPPALPVTETAAVSPVTEGATSKEPIAAVPPVVATPAVTEPPSRGTGNWLVPPAPMQTDPLTVLENSAPSLLGSNPILPSNPPNLNPALTLTPLRERTPPLPSREPILLLQPGSDERIPLPHLAAACAVAADNAVIEIHTNNVLTIQDTMQVLNKRLRIRPASGFRPVLRFDLSAPGAVRTFSSRTVDMLHVDRGAVELYDLDLEMVVSPDSTSEWAMVSLENQSSLTARGVSFTMVNPQQLPAMLVHVPYDESSDLGGLMPERATTRPPMIELNGCFCRGEFDFAVQRSTSNVTYRLENVGIVASGTLLRIDGFESYDSFMEPDPRQVTTLSLNHVTAVLGRGLLQADSGDRGHIPELQLAISDSVIRVEQEGEPLINLAGHDDYEVLLDRLTMIDNRNPSFFELDGPLCVVASTSSRFADARQVTASQLGSRTHEIVDVNLLMLPPHLDLKTAHQVQPSELHLRQDDDLDFINPAQNAAGDRQNAGVDWTLPRLPQRLPTPPVPGTPPARSSSFSDR